MMMKFSKAASVEELQVISRFESLRKILMSDEYADHRKKPLAYWALPTDRRLPLAFTMDILGETAVSEIEAAQYQARYLELIKTLAREAQNWPVVTQIDRDDQGEIPKANVSVKLSAAPNYSSEAYPFRDFTGHIKRLFDAYGPKRCYWGSDITNGFDKSTYKQRITHFTEELPVLSEEDTDWVMGRSILERLMWT